MKKIILLIFSSLFLLMSSNIFAANTNLTFATDATYPPFESMDTSGQMQGFDVDILKALCQQMKSSCTFVNQSWDSLIPSLQLGKFDGIFGAINITQEREQQVSFTKPYYYNSGSFVALKTKIPDLLANKFKGRTIGVQTGSTYAQYLQNTYGHSVHVNTYNSIQSAFLDLTSGRVDAVLSDTPISVTWLRSHGEDYDIVGDPITDMKYFGNGYGIAVKKGNQALLQQLNEALDAIKANGTYDKIVTRYFGKSQ